MVKLRVRGRRKTPKPREVQRPASAFGQVFGLVRARLHRAGIGRGGLDRGPLGAGRDRGVSVVVPLDGLGDSR